MKIYVCVKHVPDTAATIRIEGDGRIDENIAFIMNPYDENAVEEAVRLKRQTPDAEVVAVTLGKESAEATLRSALAMGADRGILVTSATSHDSIATAGILCAAIKQDGAPAIVFTGKEAIDSEGCQTMFHLGAGLGCPVVSNAVGLDLGGETATVTCELEAGTHERIRVELPCVVGAAKDLNQPSYPKLPDILKARKKPLTIIALSNLKMDKIPSRVELIEMEPLNNERQPEVIDGTVDEIADAIIAVLRDKARVIN